MKIVIVHARYVHRGGEDSVVDQEIELLQQAGHTVRLFERRNEVLTEMSPVRQASITIANHTVAEEFRAFLQEDPPDVVHVHNTFQVISPLVIRVAHQLGVPVVQTLHNYRLLCANGLLYREDGACELCVTKSLKWPAIKFGCYRGKAGSTAVALMLSRSRPIYREDVTRFIALTEFGKRKFIEGGLPEARITVKPNALLRDPGVGSGSGGYVLYVGRLSHEKGIQVLLEAWKSVRNQRLLIVGTGPMEDEVRQRVAQLEGVQWLGKLEPSEVMKRMQDAALMVLPSVCYEGLPMTIIEALACGTPVLTPNHGAMPGLGQEASLTYEAPFEEQLATKLNELLSHREGLAELRPTARATYEARYTPEQNLASLEAIYRDAVADCASKT